MKRFLWLATIRSLAFERRGVLRWSCSQLRQPFEGNNPCEQIVRSVGNLASDGESGGSAYSGARGYGEEVFEVDVSPFAVDGGRMLAVDTAVVREIITGGETPCASIAKIGEILRVVVSVTDDDIEGHEPVESCDLLAIRW